MKNILRYLLIALLFSSCGVNYNLRRAAHHTKQAIAKGAKIHSDTTWTTIPIISPEIRFETTLRPINLKDTLIVKGEKGAITKVFIHRVDTVIKSVFVQTICPEQVIEKKVPIAVNNEIKTPRGFWYYLRWMVGSLIAGFILGAIFWASLWAWIKSVARI